MLIIAPFIYIRLSKMSARKFVGSHFARVCCAVVVHEETKTKTPFPSTSSSKNNCKSGLRD